MLAPNVYAANKYLRAGAAGTGSGNDWTNAYASAATLKANLARGDTGYIADGAYTGIVCDTAPSGATLITIKKATVADHGIATGWLDAYGDGVATFSNQISFLTSYWVFDGQVGGGPANWRGGHGFRVTELDTGAPIIEAGIYGTAVGNISVAHVELVGNANQQSGGGSLANDAVSWWGGANLTISYCWLHDIGRCPFFLSGTGFVAEYCMVESFLLTNAAPPNDTHGEIASIWDFSTKAENLTFRWSVFTHCASTGGLIFTADGGPGGLYIYGNVFYQNNAFGQWIGNAGVIGGWTGYPITNAKVHNNTFINIDGDVPIFGGDTGSGNEVRNNLFYTVGEYGGFPSSTASHNHFIGTTSTGSNSTTGSGNPFTNYTALDFSPTANTTAGTNLGSPYNVDMLGRTRTTWTRGAIEFATGGTPPPPPPIEPPPPPPAGNPPVISAPISISVSRRANVTLAVAAIGDAPLTYQWYKNGTTMAGKTTSTLTLTNVGTGASASYKVIVKNAAGEAQAVCSLTVP